MQTAFAQVFEKQLSAELRILHSECSICQTRCSAALVTVAFVIVAFVTAAIVTAAILTAAIEIVADAAVQNYGSAQSFVIQYYFERLLNVPD